jgi:hypothetical protein
MKAAKLRGSKDNSGEGCRRKVEKWAAVAKRGDATGRQRIAAIQLQYFLPPEDEKRTMTGTSYY